MYSKLRGLREHINYLPVSRGQKSRYGLAGCSVSASYDLIGRHNNFTMSLLYLGGCCTKGHSSSLAGSHPQFLAIWVST